MAAHSYRAWLFQHEGLTVWNAQWYGGHHVLGLLAAVRPAGGGDRAGATSASLSAGRRPSRSSVPSRARRRSAARAGAATPPGCSPPGVLSNVLIGRMPFLLGIALTVGGVVGRALKAPACSRACWRCARCWPRPVAGVFLMLGAAAKLIADGRPGADDRAVARAARAWRAGSGSICCFPEGGTRPLHGDRVLADARDLGRRRRPARAPGRRTLWAGGLLYLGVLVGGVRRCRRRSGRTRCGSACSPARACSRSRTASASPVLGAGRRRRRPALPAVAARRAGGGRGARRPVHPPGLPGRGARTSSRAWPSPGERVEVPMTRQPLGGRRPAPRSSRSRAGGSASSTRRPTRSSTTASR